MPIFVKEVCALPTTAWSLWPSVSFLVSIFATICLGNTGLTEAAITPATRSTTAAVTSGSLAEPSSSAGHRGSPASPHAAFGVTEAVLVQDGRDSHDEQPRPQRTAEVDERARPPQQGLYERLREEEVRQRGSVPRVLRAHSSRVHLIPLPHSPLASSDSSSTPDPGASSTTKFLSGGRGTAVAVDASSFSEEVSSELRGKLVMRRQRSAGYDSDTAVTRIHEVGQNAEKKRWELGKEASAELRQKLAMRRTVIKEQTPAEIGRGQLPHNSTQCWEGYTFGPDARQASSTTASVRGHSQPHPRTGKEKYSKTKGSHEHDGSIQSLEAEIRALSLADDVVVQQVREKTKPPTELEERLQKQRLRAVLLGQRKVDYKTSGGPQEGGYSEDEGDHEVDVHEGTRADVRVSNDKITIAASCTENVDGVPAVAAAVLTDRNASGAESPRASSPAPGVTPANYDLRDTPSFATIKGLTAPDSSTLPATTGGVDKDHRRTTSFSGSREKTSDGDSSDRLKPWLAPDTISGVNNGVDEVDASFIDFVQTRLLAKVKQLDRDRKSGIINRSTSGEMKDALLPLLEEMLANEELRGKEDLRAHEQLFDLLEEAELQQVMAARARFGELRRGYLQQRILKEKQKRL
ncbi:unnamed protein product [Amoebophrya sp. A25]|nr:unnamed protein product [Amoebophrya sp. A25]|eukprot:GSA25T00004358001.1